MAPTKQSSRQGKGKEVLSSTGEEEHTKLVSEPGKGDVHDYVQGINTNLQQQEQTWSSGSGQPQLQGIRGNNQLEEHAMLFGGRRQQGFVGGHQQCGGPVMMPRFGMEPVRQNVQEGFLHNIPSEACVRGCKISFLEFDGSKDPTSWFRRAEKFDMLQQHQEIYSWAQLEDAMNRQFGPSDYQEYTTRFNRLTKRVSHDRTRSPALVPQMLKAMAENEAPISADTKKRITLLESEEDFLTSWKSIQVAEEGDFDYGTPPSKKKGFKLDKLDFNFNGPGGFDPSMNATTHIILPSLRRSMVPLKENASALGLSNSDDTPFSVLGDAMPHLKVEARPPSGFNEPKPNDYTLDASVRAKITTGTSILPSSVDEIECAMREQMQRHGSMTDTEKRFLESLMSGGNNSNPQLDSHFLSVGLHRSAGNSREVKTIAGLNSGVDVAYLLEQKLSIERQMSLSNSYGYWPGRESTSVMSKADVVAESPTLHSRILPHTGDTSHQVFKPQNIELKTMLQATGDKSSQAVNKEVPTWSNFSDIRSMSASMLSDGNNVLVGYMTALENKAEINPHDLQSASLNGSQFPQQRYQQQLSSTPLLMNQQPVMELFTGKLLLDNMLPLVPLEPHILNLSRYSQQSVPSHTSILDGLLKQPLHVQQQKELLLQQQQHLQQQQQQLQQQQQFQQQQHLFFQMLVQTHLYFGESSHMDVRSSSLDHHGLHHQVSEPVHLSSRVPHNFQSSGEDFSSEQFPQLPSAVASTAGLEGVLLKMPNQIFGSTELSGSWSAVHFFVLPLEEIDMALGIQWLMTLRSILWNLESLTMSFTAKGKTIELQGQLISQVSCVIRRRYPIHSKKENRGCYSSTSMRHSMWAVEELW